MKEYKFVTTDAEQLVSQLIATYEQITGTTVAPASPERLFLQVIADIIIHERVILNFVGNQSIPSRATGENLDALGELFFNASRPLAQPAVCTMRFNISEAQTSAVLIPAGTRVTDTKNTLVWETVEDVYVGIGQISAEVQARCQTPGAAGNGYTPGQINTAIDVFPYYDSCENITTSAGGADVATDAEFYERLRASQDAFSTAGARGSYIYHAKKVSTEIADVVAISPEAGEVELYVLMNDGTPAGAEIKNAVLAACSDETVRPLTDHVTVADPVTVSYDINLTYYIPRNTTKSPSEIEAAVDAAVDEYIKWQHSRLGRDINPSYLIGLLMQTGIKRVELTSPTFTELSDGSEGDPPEVAVVGTVTVTNGGYEDE